MLAGTPEAEDLTQEVFFRLYEHLSHGGTITNSRSWLFRVAHNLAIDCLRQRALGEYGYVVPLDTVSDLPARTAESAEDKLLADERKVQLEAALAWLSPQQRQCLELRVEGLAYREIGEVLGIHISSVRTFIARAIVKIAERLDA
jgi:RNA polymerase sigma-70 factor (ECF subfamily)